ncbi:MAG TPA: prepilin-type N-terminal cleavage/methylation domain-containing protein [Gemmatales bacterium]|nr:prepilin-type N-terminal cleavage/methylation domain-containing protein [Gemmatales bacterium]
MNTRVNRSGFTLVEILIVLGIIAAVAAIFVPVALNLTERNQVPKAASMLENALHLAKARAVAEKRPNGIRLLVANNSLRSLASGPAFAWYDAIEYIEDPGDYVNGWVWGLSTTGPQVVEQPFWTRATPIPGELPAGIDAVTVAANIPNFQAQTFAGVQTITSAAVPRSQLLFGPISPIVSGGDNNQWVGNSGTARLTQRMAYNWYARTPVPVQPGDVVEITGVGELYQVVAVSIDQVGGANNTNVNISGNGNAIRVPILVLDRPLSRDVSPSLNSTPNFRIIRQPRAIPALSTVKLPQDVVIDLTLSRTAFLGNPNADLDTNNSFFMSGVSIGLGVTGITGITTATPNIAAPLYVDIMFSASGEMMPTAQVFRNGAVVGSFSVGASGLVALWIHQRGDPNLWANRQATAAQGNADNQAIVAVNARTGFIGSYPMTPLAISTDPLNYARIGKARTSADTGQ